MSPARLWLGMAATQQGGRRPGAGRPARFVPAASKRPARTVLKFELEHLEAAGRISLGLTVCGASSLAFSIYAHACVIPDRGTVCSGIRFYNYVMYRSAHARPVAQHQCRPFSCFFTWQPVYVRKLRTIQLFILGSI